MIGLSLTSDLYPLTAAVLSAAACALVGNYLVLRRVSLVGDAISHSVLPGIVAAFILTGAREPAAMLAGAAAAGLATVAVAAALRRVARLEPGAALGVTFTIMFALGVLLIETNAARSVDLDAGCVLYGELETLVWWDRVSPDAAPATLAAAIADAPPQIGTLAVTAAVAAAFVAVFFKELRIASFDPGAAAALGMRPNLVGGLLMLLVAGVTVASFEAVGSILVIAMLIAPAAAARLLTDRLGVQLGLSLAIAVGAAVAGYLASALVPAAFGADSVNAGGSITVVLGFALAGAALLGPKHGVLPRLARRRASARAGELDDLLAALFRREEAGAKPAAGPAEPNAGRARRVAIKAALRRGLVARGAGGLILTPAGRDAAGRVVRRHRLWETYLVDEANLAPDHVHGTAERLEHLPLAPETQAAEDPHGRPIPGGGRA